MYSSVQTTKTSDKNKHLSVGLGLKNILALFFLKGFLKSNIRVVVHFKIPINDSPDYQYRSEKINFFRLLKKHTLYKIIEDAFETFSNVEKTQKRLEIIKLSVV